jgi:hypothetical protein
MSSNQRTVLSLSVPSEMAREYRALARERGENASEMFRDMYTAWRGKQLKARFRALQAYGVARAAETGVTEKDIERLVFGGR